ncbi:MAG: glycosyltransferase [Saccharospirillaceae bacterium]|nr:glycosyltransferase family 2 protein [Pseudomonadales bacterium]NRB77717.1 glycosyltransferase [Saccharospirillaceae bacterium]
MKPRLLNIPKHYKFEQSKEAIRSFEALKSGEKYQDYPTKWTKKNILHVSIYFALCFLLVLNIPNNLWDPSIKHITFTLGGLGVWRYSWWLVHVIRSEIYQHKVFPKIRTNADKCWDDGWRPRGVHFMMTTFLEKRETTELVLQSICREVRDTQIHTTLWLGSGAEYAEKIMVAYLKQHAKDLPFEFVMIRQNVSGKRMAIGLVLRAMSRRGIHKDDLIVFMDGDAVLAPGILNKCCPLFKIDPQLQAVTTDEEVICYGPQWIQSWLIMRFSQRRLAMQSHSLSNKVLTLTGRMSVFRANHLTKYDFIRMLEADHLRHWLWGDFRFLSGDDKSTWYYMLTQDAKMLYVPDALVYTIEEIEGLGIERMTQNLKRWSGNMLRNGTRALLLGPRKINWFIWWCVLDQRIAMWTMLVSPIVALSVTFLKDANYILAYIIWILVSRMCLSLFLFRYSNSVHIEWPIILYINQLLNAAVKVYCMARLSKQRWTNRGNQSSDEGNSLADRLRDYMAFYMTVVWVTLLIFITMWYTKIIILPNLGDYF